MIETRKIISDSKYVHGRLTADYKEIKKRLEQNLTNT